MHRWLVLFVVLLLPLRSWAGGALPGKGLQPTPAHHAVAAAAAQHSAEDCAGHGAPAGELPRAEPAHEDCPTCADCQACSGVALQPGAAMPLGDSFCPAPAQPVRAAYRSATPPPLLKPPIS